MLVVVLGGPVIIHCHAIGWPRPSVTWWRGERMLPLSSERYEQFRDYSLLVRRVSFRDLGPYTCQAYNGYGRPSSFTVVLQAVGPVYSVEADEVEFQRYLIPAPQPEQRPPVSSATTISPFRPARPTPPSYTPAPQRPTLGIQLTFSYKLTNSIKLLIILHQTLINSKWNTELILNLLLQLHLLRGLGQNNKTTQWVLIFTFTVMFRATHSHVSLGTRTTTRSLHLTDSNTLVHY